MRSKLALALLLLAAPLSAQSLGSKVLSRYDEQITGAIGNLAIRGPWVAKSWRSTIPRVAIFTTLSFAYERLADASHGGHWDAQARRDFTGREVGYLLTEGLITLYLTIKRH